MNMYHRLIAEATGRTNRTHIYLIEDCMRNVVFHSTLDWQTKAEFVRGARKAERILKQTGELT